MDYAQQMFEKLNLPPGSSFSLLDHQGIILIRNLNDPFSEKLIGSRDTREELFTKMTEGPDEGTFEAMGNDGKFRLAAYKKISLPHESKPYLYIRSSIPLASATSKANAAMFRNLSAFVSLFLIGLFLAWFIGKRIIVRPAMMLKGAAGQLAAGADTVNVSSRRERRRAWRSGSRIRWYGRGLGSKRDCPARERATLGHHPGEYRRCGHRHRR